jgi:hypothetical protein
LKLVYFNDRGRLVEIHPATVNHGCVVNKETIKPLQEREFILPEGTYAWIKMWDYEEFGLSILVSPMTDNS